MAAKGTIVGGKTQPAPPPRFQEITPEQLKQRLGYPDIFVKTEGREKYCPNCGRKGHDETECNIPTMEELFKEFGAHLYDSSYKACEEKKRIIRKHFEDNA